MLRFRTLGGAAGEPDAGPLGGAAAQRKSLAFLAVAATAVSVATSSSPIFGPDTHAERAGHRLTYPRFDRAPIECRADGKRRRRVRAGPSGRAVGAGDRAVWGPFLDGFFLSGAPEFERWVDNERAGLARDYAEALETLAAEAVAQGDLGHAADPIWDPLRGTPSYVALLKKLKLDF